MAEDKFITDQGAIDHIWEKEWQGGNPSDLGVIFQHRLFLEGYPIFARYIPKDAKRILDVGAGTGRYGLKFAQDYPKSHVTITDVLPESLMHIEAYRHELNVSNVSIQKESALQLSFHNETFDVVFCDVVIQHLPDYRQAFSEMSRVLAPGGTLIVSTNNVWNIPHTAYKLAHRVLGRTYRYGLERSFTRGELAALANEKALDVVALDGFYFAYGVYRWKEYFTIFKFVGGVLNRISQFLDKLTSRGFSRYFGFEIFVVARKK